MNRSVISMNADPRSRLNLIDTRWTLVVQAHAEGTVAAVARRDLFDRYCGAAWRYMLAVTRREDVAEELFQEFALRLMRGDFCRATAQRGRFRDYLKAVLINLVRDFYRARQTGPARLPENLVDPRSISTPRPHSAEGSPSMATRGAAASADAQTDLAFLDSWRNELLHRTWAALEHESPKLYAVLRTHIELADASAREKADQHARRTGEPFTANHFRVALHRARARFASLLRREVAASLDRPTDDQLNDELKQLRLLQYCTIQQQAKRVTA